MDLLFSLALTTHLGFFSEYNEIHPHIQLSGDKYNTGIYYNSVREISFYASRKINYGDIGLEFGLANGYEPIPVIPYSRVTYDYVDNIRLFGTTAFEKHESKLNAGLVMGIEFILNP